MDREINDLEYLYYGLGQPYNIAIMLRIKGTINIELLKTIFKNIQTRHPLLKARIDKSNGKIPRLISEHVGEIPIKILKKIDDSQSKQEFDGQLMIPFDFTSENLPLIRAVILQSEGFSDLILCSLHMISDGLSMVYLARDIIQYLNNPNEPVILLDVPGKNQDIFPKKIRRMIPKTALPLYLLYPFLKLFHKLKFSFNKRKTNVPAVPKSNKDELAIYSFNLTEKQTDEIIQRCKREKVTVHCAICTAFLPDVTAINNPVNLRNRLSVSIGESFGLFVGATVVKKKYRESQNFWTNARNYQKKLRWHLRDRQVYFPQRLLSKAISLSFMEKIGIMYVDLLSNQKPFAVTNLGSLDKLQLTLDSDKYSIESFYGGVSPILDAFSVLVFTLRKKMFFHMHFLKSKYELSNIEDLANNIMKRLFDASN